MKRLDDFRRVLAQTESALERLKTDATSLRSDLGELRSLGDHLGHGYTKLGDICRLTEKRSELTVDVLDAIEKRIEPLEVVRGLSAATEESLGRLHQLVEEVSQSGARFADQKEAIDAGRKEAADVAHQLEVLQARFSRLTEQGKWLGEAEATVARLEHRAVETTSRLDRRMSDFDTEKQDIDRSLTDAIRAAAIMNALERRIEALTAGDHGLGHAGDTITRLEQRASDTTAQIEQRVTAFDAHKLAIEQAAIEATRITATMSALEARVTALAGGEQGLGFAETTIAGLEQRAAAAATRLGQHVGDFDGRRQTIEQALAAARTETEQALTQAEETAGWLEQRAAESSAEFERRVSHFDTQRQTIEQRLASTFHEGEARLSGARETVHALERQAADTTVRIERRVSQFGAEQQAIEQTIASALTSGGRTLEAAAAAMERLEQRAAEATAHLDRRLVEFDTRGRTIERTLATAAAGSDQGLRRAEETVRRLEQRASAAAAQLERCLDGFDARTRAGAQPPAESARSAVTLPPSAAAGLSLRIRRPLLRFAAVFVTLVGTEMLGVVMMRTTDRPVRVSRAAPARKAPPAVQPGAAAAAMPTILPSTASRLAMFVLPAGRPVGTAGVVAGSAASPAGRQETARGPLTAQGPVAARESGAAKEAPQYVGALAVDSEPAGSVVFLDGQEVGETPLVLTRLAAGSHVVRIDRDGYDRWTTAAIVAADKETRVSARLQSARAR